MPISNATLSDAIVALSRIKGVYIDPKALVEDLVILSYALPDENEYCAAVANTCKALEQLSGNKVQSSTLKHQHRGWYSYHYQHSVAQNAKADMRIMYRRENETIYVRGFGHRKIPEDFYRRMAVQRT